MMTSQDKAAPYRLLIADDDRAALETFRDVLEPAGYQTVLARDGQEAVEVVRRERTLHLALMDMYMPGLTGLEVLEVLRQLDRALPAILISADHDEELMRRALQARAFTVVAKPVSKDVLIYVVSRALAKFYAPRSGEMPA
ncbi:MAG: hypothetical protein KatS3mg108_3223 [Isosphaeraceae bacterium]|jgi:CheY-like chemotaxis protein|nr:MAG: hypothetical protein KatS3mg108_3223 [Isosphaeraceae bacterium]